MKKTVLLDLDGVLAHYEHWQGIEHIGEPLPGAVEFTRDLSHFAHVVIFTTRCKQYLGTAPPPAGVSHDPSRLPAADLAFLVKTWLDRHGFVYDEIYTGQGKPFGCAIIDDRAVSCRPMQDRLAYCAALAQAQRLCRDTAPAPKLLEESEAT